ncbi:MAG: S41 family peptidase [Pyrinomonadaceae bacterium]
MTYRGKFLVAIVSAIIAFYALSGFVFRMMEANAQQPINDAGAQLRIFESVLQHIENDYVDEPNLAKVKTGALKGLAYGLDPYSSYLTPEQVQSYEKNNGKSGAGIGADFSQFSYLYTVSVIPGSPADKAGLKIGDSIEYIDDHATRDYSLYDSRQFINGAKGSTVKLRVLRAGEKPLTISVVRGDFQIPAATGEVKDGVGIVKVFSLQPGQAETARNQIKALKGRGVDKIVLDLRNVSGGDINEGVSLANAVVKTGTLAKIVGKQNAVVKSFSADPSKFIYDGKLAVLTDFSTSDAAEVVAAAVETAKRGEVVGERTFGAGSDQKLFPLREGDGLLLTVEKWTSPEGVAFMADKRTDSGVKPTVEVKHPDTPTPIEDTDTNGDDNEDETPVDDKQDTTKTKSTEEDLQMKKAIEILNSSAKAAAA